MSQFLTPLHVVQVQNYPKAVWRLEDDLIYASDMLADMITVPKGFRTDFASVPRIPFAYMLTGGKANAASVLHDWFYSTRAISRKQADDLFYEAILASGHSQWTAWLMWLGVRVGGGWTWRKDNVPQIINIDAF